jgi:S1-C subfamily serine protease
VRTPVAPSAESRPIGFEKLIVKIPRGTKIGKIEVGGLCLENADLTWKGGRVAVDSDEFADVLKDELEAGGFKVAWDPEAMFEDRLAWQAEFLIGGTIKELQMYVCYKMAGLNNWTEGDGEALVRVDWQVYSRRTRQVELKVSTEGSTQRIQIRDTGPAEPIIQAFGRAVRNLLAEQTFVDLVAPPNEPTTTTHWPPLAIELASTAVAAGPVEAVIDRARSSVMTIFAGSGHGSGFLISRDGYVLTNQHVVGDARTVNVKFLTGREVVGEVVRTHRTRDVALVKLAQDVYASLPLATSADVRPGTEVFAIGTPLAERMGQSVTRGVVSGFREEYGERFIQSDVTVHPGNSGGPLLTSDGRVVGIAAQGLSTAGVPLGINLFVPIEEALADLAIERVD